MSPQTIREILHLRMAVYQSGVKHSFWQDINDASAMDTMQYLFPKSGQIAFYHLMLEQMRQEHSMLTGGVYYLFKLPVQAEKEIMDYLKTDSNLAEYSIQDSDSYLQQMDTIATDHSIGIVNIGKFTTGEFDSILRLCASHYRYAFLNNLKSYPYFD